MGKFFSLKKSFVSFFLLIIALSILMYSTLEMLMQETKEIVEAGNIRYESYVIAKEVTDSSAELTKMVRSFVMSGNPKYEKRYIEIVEIGSGKRERPDGKTIARLDLMRDMGFTKEEFEKISESQKLSFDLVKTEEKAMNAIKGLFDDGAGGYTKKGPPDLELARQLVNDEHYENEVDKIKRPVEEFFTLMNKRTQGNVLESEKDSLFAYIAALSALIVMGVATVIVLLLLYRLIKRQLEISLSAAEQLAKGDLTIQLSTNRTDELGRLVLAIQGIGQGLTAVVGDVRSGTEAINVASKEIALGNIDLSSRTESQASSLEETASSMEELTSAVRQNADNARQANQLVTATVELAQKGGEVVSSVVVTMESIKESSAKIGDIISVIDGIAFQTNILALNAAVEAARAGEQGRGFAVVASEVRTLAQRSANAAKEIKDLIGDSVNKVNAGGQLVHDAGITMNEVVTSVKNVASIMAEISAAGEEQSAGINQVNNAVAQMDEITQQNAALVEESAAAAESLQEQSDLLLKTVSIFKLSGVHHQKSNEAKASGPRKAANLTPKNKVTSPENKSSLKEVSTPLGVEESKSAKKLLGPSSESKPDDGWEQF